MSIWAPVGYQPRQGTDRYRQPRVLILSLLAIAVLAMGLYPRPFTDVMDASVAELLKHVALQKLN